ncbi:hypothetical protein [Dactylosporangium matsuzakiense]|uniref:Lipoprotein n=1 Tax=Dactylosporangium matsuzakiense TaxID=53360 RepID=A0A9W6KKN4_9ACTN|nr:hypothetical protein [Dactylosporangium matsuzakiense]UWZ46626.1 hypothetical protein Dmats_09485 [Dactylosporangium matsuzakiense]GLL01239.1 hypothetical protein GCM10017581_029800 [Dactylosporangium matsuzakiense]
MRTRFGAILLVAVLGLTACGDDEALPTDPGDHFASAAAAPSDAASEDPGGTGGVGAAPGGSSPAQAAQSFAFGNPDGHAAVPAEAKAESVAQPTWVIGDGTPASCTSERFVAAVKAGGTITFNCGPSPLTIVVKETAKIRNRSPKVVIDGGGKVTLSGEGKRRILYQNTCDKDLEWTTDHCQDQATPALTVQNIVLADGNSTGDKTDGGGGGAVFVRGGRFKAVNAKFVRNRCDDTGPDLGGAAVRVLSQYQNKPVYIVGSTFGGSSGQGGVCANGGALSSIQVSWVVLNSIFSYNTAVGRGANPARAGTPGGGSGGAIYCDGDNFTVKLAGTLIEQNKANEGGGAVFFVSNDRTGTMAIESSTLRKNPSAGFETDGFPGIFFLGARPPSVSGSSLTK